MFLFLPAPALAWWLLPALAARAVLPVPAGVRDLLMALTHARHRQGYDIPTGFWLRVAGWVLLIIALAGPQTSGAPLLKPTGRDLIVAVDLSSSMDENDMMENSAPVARYEIVRKLLGRFIEQRAGDRVGLIAFGHDAFLVAPLTFDSKATAATLSELTIGLPGHRTDLGRAVGLAIQTFKDTPSGNRVLVLLSDGEDNSGALTGSDAAKLAASYDITIHTIGFASAIDSDGAQTLSSMASATGGAYYLAQSAEALEAVSEKIEAIEPTAVDESADRVRKDWNGFVILLCILALAGIAVRELHEW